MVADCLGLGTIVGERIRRCVGKLSGGSDFVAVGRDHAEHFSERRDWRHSIFQANERMCFGVYANLHEDIKRWALQLDRVRVYVQCSFPPVHRNRYPLRVCELVGDVRV